MFSRCLSNPTARRFIRILNVFSLFMNIQSAAMQFHSGLMTPVMIHLFCGAINAVIIFECYQFVKREQRRRMAGD